MMETGVKEFFRRIVLKSWLICIALFLVLCIGAYIAMKAMPEQATKIADEFMNMVEDGGIVGEDGNITWYMLLFNNLKASGLMFILGFIPFLFLPVFSLLSNAVIIGAVMGLVNASGVNVLGVTLKGLIPHGIFEIPAICMACALGIILCRFLIAKIINAGKLKGERPLDMIGNMFRLYVIAVVPLLVIAAIIETYITPMIMGIG